MADFDLAFQHVQGKEGLYSNVAADRGKETYKGISRVHWPAWAGWDVLDRYKINGVPDKPLIAEDLGLQRLVRDFYLVEFWQPMHGDEISSQIVAEELFDSAVNCGPGHAVVWLQWSLNALNQRGKRWPDITPDRNFGPATLDALRDCLARGLEVPLYKFLNSFQGVHYVTLTMKDPTQEAFAVGWAVRVYENKEV